MYTSGLAGGLVYGDRFAQRPTCERRGARLRNIRGVFRCVLGTDPCPKRAKLSLSVNSWGILIVLGVDLPVALIAFFASTWKRFRFIADKQTRDLVGKNQLVHSLQRVLDVSSPNPSFAQKRIDKLT